MGLKNRGVAPLWPYLPKTQTQLQALAMNAPPGLHVKDGSDEYIIAGGPFKTAEMKAAQVAYHVGGATPTGLGEFRPPASRAARAKKDDATKQSDKSAKS